MSFAMVQEHGVRIFATPFNKHDGYGDGPYDPSEDPRHEGGRPTMQFNDTYMRVNGLDGQTCLECHFIKKNSTIPFTFGIAGTAGPNSNAIFKPSFIDVADYSPGGFNGRFINPLILFGTGGVELVSKEMTLELQQLLQAAKANPGKRIDLKTKGVDFGYIVADGSGNVDTAHIEGIDEDLVLRPFGRKGDFSTIRDFDLGAMRFHFGIEPVEVTGLGVDNDGDGVLNELSVGEISALGVWVATRERPNGENFTDKAWRGYKLFGEIGCTQCHIPSMSTKTRYLTFSFPEVETDPTRNVFYKVDLAENAGFTVNRKRGIDVHMYSDLKRHDMGPGLAESFDLATDRQNAEFITVKLWGVRDSAPYLHDGRAQTITEAILMLGGEAQQARDNFENLNRYDRAAVLEFLYSLTTPI
jgi:hypothetical protein